MSAALETGDILVVDDDGHFRLLVRQILERAGFTVLEASDGEQALEIARTQAPGLVVLDVGLPGISGYEVLRALQETVRFDLPIIFTSGRAADKNDRISALLLGADDYFVKPFEADELLARVRRSLAHRGNGNGGPARPSPLTVLSARERQVLDLLAEGLTQTQIASHLVLSPRTVGTHIQHVLTKLDVHSRAQAVAVALRNSRDASHVLAHAGHAVGTAAE